MVDIIGFIMGQPLMSRPGKTLNLLKIPISAEFVIRRIALFVFVCSTASVAVGVDIYYFEKPYISLFLLIFAITLYFNLRFFFRSKSHKP